MYKDLYELYRKTRLDYFSMAVTYIADVGFRHVEAMTDEEIEVMQGNGLMTQDFVQSLVKYAKEIVGVCANPSELYQFCQAESIFDTRYYADKIPADELYEKLNNVIAFALNRGRSIDNIDDIAENCDIEDEDLVRLGWKTEEEVYG